MFVINDPVVFLVLKPRDVDSPLEPEMSVWVMRAPRVKFLLDCW